MRRCLLAMLLATAFPSRADIGEGSWEMEITTSVPGTTAGLATTKQTQCLRAEDARDPARLFGSPGAGCDFTDRQDDGATYRFRITCGGTASVSGNGEMRYSRDALEGEIVLRISGGDKEMETRTAIHARRVGPCT